MYLKLLRFIIPCFFSFVFHSQAQQAYYPLSGEPENIDSIISEINKKLDNDIASIPSSKHQKDVKTFYKDRVERIIYALEEGHYLFDETDNAYFYTILKEILDANPEIPAKEIRLFLSNYPWPNAMSIGEGTIVLNIGLLRRLENESQVAFVLCHEIAHYTLDHSNRKIVKNLEIMNNTATKRTLKRIGKQKYQVGRQSREFFKQFLYTFRRHQRESEAEADQLGIKYLKKTKYDAREAENVLNILDNIDKEKYEHSIRLKEVFNAVQYPFKEKWIAEEELLAFKGEEDFGIDSDSLKTHPDCQKRIKLLPDLLVNYDAPPGKNIQKMSFSEMVFMSDFEMIESFFFFDDYGRCIYHALKLLNEHPDNAYLYATIGKCFHLIYLNQSRHSLGNSVELPNNKQEPEYQELLRFLHNMRLKEMAKVNYYFLEKVKDQYMQNEDFLFAWIMANDLMGHAEQTDNLKDLYSENHPEGYYFEYLQDHETTKK